MIRGDIGEAVGLRHGALVPADCQDLLRQIPSRVLGGALRHGDGTGGEVHVVLHPPVGLAAAGDLDHRS